jgi:coenzyme F420-reducing hydrogenase beta subunit
MSIENVIENDLCVGCGACKSYLNNDVKIKMQDNGFYQANLNDKSNINDLKQASKVCPFSSDSLDEDQLGDILFKNKKHDKRVGYYNKIYTGHVIDETKRITSSSGGLTTWFAEKLLINDEVDIIVHVGQSKDFFEYKISRTISDLNETSNKKSRYYPVTFESLVEYIKNTNERILFIGIPCFVKSIRSIQHEFGLDNIKYVFSLLCGHMKSVHFAENIAWQVGISPKELKYIDFRVKKEGYQSSDYFVEVESKKGKKVLHKNTLLLGSNWGHGFFKHKACDFCDDLAGELADVTFGDAWLPQYSDDYLGTNIIVSRNDLFDKYLIDYKNEIKTETVTVDVFYETQAANYRHRRDGLKVRVENETGWLPKKRMYLSEKISSRTRNKIYMYRRYMSDMSTKNFLIAKKNKSIFVFKLLMFPIILKSDYINFGVLRTIKKNIKKIIRFRLFSS